jgi:hypothetical protein
VIGGRERECEVPVNGLTTKVAWRELGVEKVARKCGRAGLELIAWWWLNTASWDDKARVLVPAGEIEVLVK